MTTPANAKNDVLVKKLGDRLAEVEVEILCEGEAKKKAEAK